MTIDNHNRTERRSPSGSRKDGGFKFERKETTHGWSLYFDELNNSIQCFVRCDVPGRIKREKTTLLARFLFAFLVIPFSFVEY